MTRIITYGTFDLLHYGHINLLQRARAMGGHLTVAVSTDAFNLTKGKASFFPFPERVALVEAVRYVDEVIAEESWEQKVDDILTRKIDIFVIGDDWTGRFDFLKPFCKVVYLSRTPEISTTAIKQGLAAGAARLQGKF